MKNPYLHKYILWNTRIWRVTHVLHTKSTMPEEYRLEELISGHRLLHLKKEQIKKCDFISIEIIKRIIK